MKSEGLTREDKIELYEIYCSLLADKQKEYFKLYYLEDWSLGEIAEQFDISRQAVLSAIETAISNLISFEKKINLLRKRKQQLSILDQINNLKEDNNYRKNVKKLIKKLRSIYV
ncbi:MAG TPA: sigma factor-like helix-turn-helix DNA-binding protein [Candidatus Mcinerneyibacterium sp.]|nr:sigma factor-like helix-turn-helix DNA-binding protein [Candidatus Mcinerneyibacterium sp.]